MFAALVLLAACGTEEGPVTPVTPPTEPVTRVIVTPSQSTVDPGAQVPHSAQAFDAQNREIPGVTFTWSSSDTVVARVAADGTAAARLWGEATITARAGSVTGSSRVTVNAAPIPLVKAFPEAEGYGALALRDCRTLPLAVHQVTNTESAGPGTLLEAVNRLSDEFFDVIVFTTGGTITLYHVLELNVSCVYMAGQTAPGGGIQLKSPDEATHTNTPIAFPSEESPHDLVLRFLRIRSGRGEPGKPDNIRSSSAHNVIFDHLSTAFANDESIDLAATAGAQAGGEITLQWSIMAAGLSPHSAGVLISGNPDQGPYPTDISIHKNAFVHNTHRNPLVRRTQCVEIVNNVIYNWRGRVGNIEGNACVDIVGNYMRAGPWTRLGDYWQVVIDVAQGITEDPTVYVDANVGDPFHLNPLSPQDVLVKYGRDREGALPAGAFRSAPQASPAVPIEVRSARNALDAVVGEVGASRRLTCEGAWTPVRDALDALFLGQISSGGGPVLDEDNDHQSDYGGIPVLDPGTPCPDSDGDGMPDAYEARFGFDPTDPSDAGEDRDRDGYLNIEEYLNVTDPLSS